MVTQPPYSITPKIIQLISDISQNLGKITLFHLPEPSITLRRENRILTVYSSLEIEGNILSKEQVTAILEGRHVVGPTKDILEVKNAIEAYESIPTYNPFTQSDFLSAHRSLLFGLIEDAGQLRHRNVGVLKGDHVAHMAPKYTLVPKLIDDVFDYINQNQDLHMLILSSVFHYEIEFIHPFSDGNGRIGRLWQTVMLYHWNPLFLYLPVESLIQRNQSSYYDVLAACDQSGESTLFIEFMLAIINQTICEFLPSFISEIDTSSRRLMVFKHHWKQSTFSRRDYLSYFNSISSSTASRDLIDAVSLGLLGKQGEKNQTLYFFTD